MSVYGLSPADATVLTEDRDVAVYFEAAVAAGRPGTFAPKTVSNWIIGELFRLLKAEDAEIGQVPVDPAALVGLVALVERGTITANSGKAVMGEMLATGRSADEIVAEKGLAQVSDQDALAEIVDDVLAANPEQVARYRDGKETLLQWFRGAGNAGHAGARPTPRSSQTLLEEKLEP